MSKSNVESVRAVYEAFRRQDIPSVFQLLDAAIEVYQSKEVPWGGCYKGHEQVQEFFSTLARAIDSKIDPDEYLDAGDQVVALGYTLGTAKATGRKFQIRAVHVWTLKNRKAVRFEAYIDNAAMQKALEGCEQSDLE